MNKILLYVFVVLLPLGLQAQIIDGTSMDSTTLHFTTDSIPGFTGDTASIPLWQIGRTHKTFFADTSGLDSSGYVTIMTDTVAPYRVNANNWFVIKITNGLYAIVDFWHKYQTTQGHDGGVVEFSQDGFTWQNMKGDCNADANHLRGLLTTNFYSTTDTLVTGEPSFNGLSDSVIYSRFQFWGGPRLKSTSGTGCDFSFPYDFYVRFRFISDSLADTLAGWIIDSIKIERDQYPGAVATVSKQNVLNVHPNPSYDGTFTFPNLENQQRCNIEVYNSLGEKILETPYTRSLNLGAYSRGLYFYRITGGLTYYSGQLQLE